MTTLQSQDARFARDLRLMSISEHLDREPDDIVDLIDPVKSFEAVRVSARRLQEWKDGGARGPARRGA